MFHFPSFFKFRCKDNAFFLKTNHEFIVNFVQFLLHLWRQTPKQMKKYLLYLLSALILIACDTSNKENDYLKFLLDNMSLPDRIDYDEDFYRQQVQTALKARAEMPWGKEVPEREFSHFVLPPRVNNEDLDDFRQRYYDELAERVRGLSMEDAILEVNHWCHEHVTYRPTNSRTLGPVSTIRTAYGRCGEESVLLVAALRTVGIPARQVYTPRWAHTDDNHAWVEAWADGQWHFLGACEPEPILDLGWFNESASRGMLMHTKVFGNYTGPEEIVLQEHNLTEINVTDHYAPTRQLTICVLDSLRKPVPDAKVEFKLYNYAEFYTVASKQTDSEGRASLTAGLGDMLVWATANGQVAFRQVHFATDSILQLQLSPALSSEALSSLRASFALDVTPPAASVTLPDVAPEQREENNRRVAIEDSIRHAYEATMPDQRSRGNHAVITAFRDSAAALGKTAVAEALIKVLPDKDLQDITLDVLLDNLQSDAADDLRTSYVLSPRVERERLTAYKQVFSKAFKDFDADRLIAWTRDSIKIVEGENPRQLRTTPLGVFRALTADRLGRNIFFVAACRALGIPARINEINRKVQYYQTSASSATPGAWQDVVFDDADKSPAASPTGRLQLAYTPSRFVPDAKYYIHFTLSRLDENNQLQLLTFPEEATYNNTFAQGVNLDEGTYVLTTGTRMANGSVLASMQAFDVKVGQTTNVSLALRQNEDAVSVIGSLNAEDLYKPLTPPHGLPDAELTFAEAPTSLLATCGRGYYAIGIIAPNQEPTNHALRDISLVRNDLENWGRKLVLLFESEGDARRFNFKEFSNLPHTTEWGTDIDGSIKKEIIEQMHLTSASLPIFLICDSFNRVVFVQQGYTIGLGEQLLNVIKQL